MPNALENIRRFFAELRRRNVYRVAATYLVVAFVGLQVVNLLIPATTLPGWADELLLAFLMLGFPVAVVLAWAFEMTPDGVRRTESRGGTGAGSGYSWAGIVLVVAVSSGVWWTVSGDGSHSGVPVPAADSVAHSTSTGVSFPDRDRPFVAVLPFSNMSAEEENQYFTAGIHEEILTQLSRISGLGVFPRTTMRLYTDSEKSVAEIARELGAAAVLEGSVQRSGDRVRITVQLIDPESRDHLWAERYDRRLDDIFAVQTEIAEEVARSLDATLSPGEQNRIARHPTDDPAAHDLYLRGREAYRQYTEQANEEAIRLFRRALAADSTFALAWAGLADALIRRVSRFGYPGSWADSALRAARAAVELDPDLAEGYKALGTVYIARSRPTDALEAYLRATALAPNDHDAVESIATAYQRLGRFDEAIRWYRRSARLAPRDGNAHTLVAFVHVFLGMYDEAESWLDDALDLDPGSIDARFLQVQIALYRGDTAAALSQAAEIVESAPGDAKAWTSAAGTAYLTRDFERAVEFARGSLDRAPENELFYWHYTETLLGLSLIQQGRAAEGREILRAAMEDNRRRIEEGAVRGGPPFDLAAAHAALGNRDRAMEGLERAYEAGFVHLQWIRLDPAFDGLRDDSRYEELVRRISADIERMRERVRRDGTDGR